VDKPAISVSLYSGVMSADPRTAPAGGARGSALLLSSSAPGAAAGSASRVALVLDALHDRFSNVDIVSLAARGDEQRAPADVHLVPWAEQPSRRRYATALARGGSAFVGVRESGLKTRLTQLQQEGSLRNSYELIWSHFLIMAPAALSVPGHYRVLDADMALGAAARRAAVRPDHGWRQRLYLRLDAAATTRRERQLVAQFPRVVVASELERERLGPGPHPVCVVPNAVAVDSTARPPGRRGNYLLFVGALDYGPNLEAVSFLVDEVIPYVRARMPAAELRIVGRNPSPEVVQLTAAADVELIGDAPSLEPHYAGARVAVAPLISGGGTRIKVLEAMARALPIVATPGGVEGIHLQHGISALIADDPREFAEHCLTVLRDESLARRLGGSAHAVWRLEHQPAVAREAILGVIDSLPAPVDGGGSSDPEPVQPLRQ
jgi:polysaccharide biosynthesis protein PslH